MSVFIVVTVLWVFSVCLHEFGHAIVAYYGGDTTVREKGYLTLNPLKYTHPVMSLLLPVIFMMLGGIGLPGGAVYINDQLIRSKGWRTAVSLAGPLMNVILIFVLWLVFRFGGSISDAGNVGGPALAFLLQLEISAVLFNLLPIPPLDGFQAIAPWLPRKVEEKLMAQANLFLWILFMVMWNSPPAARLFWEATFGVADFLGVDPHLAMQGWRQFQFWRPID